MSKNPSKTPRSKKGKTLAARRLLDLASALSGLPSTSGSGSAGSIDLFSEIDPEGSTAPNSTAPYSTSQSEDDDDSVADKHYNLIL